MLQRFDRNARLEWLANYIEQLPQAAFSMRDQTKCFAAQCVRAIGDREPVVPAENGIANLQTYLMLGYGEAYDLFYWKTNDGDKPPTPAEGALKLRSMIRIQGRPQVEG